jgi:hypothetical protein
MTKIEQARVRDTAWGGQLLNCDRVTACYDRRHLLRMVDLLAGKIAEDDTGGVDVEVVIDWADKEAK